ncbi:hypothetical protein acsn021_02480 [Anaerocolumna cellulosilytica]|uniref:Uncharacterized protein n=1 Tax=Anaerocolumna cellulosilytica TaxID=433286 RepID=A0A6S6QUC6_9FIRM|nr:hypothetical protein [Anaerocolumna cellulosilytica]MBB5196920.1 hypothetical protein [Anaerocolumna cellulosilytica]BCJ92679.1 hypothetical protein acsn021_02480 [Anaerocolumna cellulosilytica]
MEHWTEIYKNVIPDGKYQTLVQNGEESGLSIRLESKEYTININFGVVAAFRMLDEGILLNEVFYNNEIIKFKNNKFANVIYKIENGEFGNFIKNACNELYSYLELEHYTIVTMNYIIEIISSGEPDIKVKKTKHFD